MDHHSQHHFITHTLQAIQVNPVNEFYRRKQMGEAGHCKDKQIDTDK